MIHISEFLSIPSFLFLFSKGITGIRFAEHQRCYIRTQTRKLPAVAEVEAEDTELLVCLLSQLSVPQTLCSPTEAVMHIVGR